MLKLRKIQHKLCSQTEPQQYKALKKSTTALRAARGGAAVGTVLTLSGGAAALAGGSEIADRYAGYKIKSKNLAKEMASLTIGAQPTGTRK